MLTSYIVSLISLAALDSVWIGWLAAPFYRSHLGYIFADKVSLVPALLFYLLYAFGVVFFAVGPAVEAKTLSDAILRGALLGLLAYGAYDLTNQATLANWPLVVTLADMAWGVIVTATASAITYIYITRFI